MKKKILFFWFFLILLLAGVLRFYRLGSLLPLFGDEVDIGYNAFSILKTRADITGHFLPVFLNTLIDAKSSLLAYLSTIPIGLFGLNDWTVRIIPALSGLGVVVLLFLITLRLFSSPKMALLVAFLAAITPWAIHFSRGAFEANLMLFLLLLGIYLFLKIKQNGWYLLESFAVFAFSFYAYHAAKVLTPLIIIGLLIFFKDYWLKVSKKKIGLAVIVLIILVLPNFYQSFFGSGQQRFNEVSLFADSQIVDQIVTKRQNDLPKAFQARFFHNKGESYFNRLTINYLESFSPQFLFLYGDRTFRHSSSGFGEIYLVCLPFFLSGLFLFLKERKKHQLFFIFLLLIAPLPGVITKDGGQHAIRSLFLLPVILIITAYGFWVFLEYLGRKTRKGKKLFYWFYPLLVLAFFFNSLFYFHQYFIHYPKESWRYWAYGYKQIMTKINEVEKDYDLVLIDNDYEPSILWFLFYYQYPPLKAQQELKSINVKTNIFDGFNGFSMDKFYFLKPNGDYQINKLLEIIKNNKKVLFLVSQTKEVGGDWDWQKDPPGGVEVLTKVSNPYDQPIFYLITHE